ncbi:GspE/PulE family protein [uncultured Pseudokineococcus sp.]|uniref:GspE/PulE family protein n=1 Tax=uncultured Pseudokineococcus sp. TaxID=1642928 RepID=UPI00262BDF8C|nr:ATPase, T2SS/T4P/T4SS family [uncultured Pseudokineococcus sp.]
MRTRTRLGDLLVQEGVITPDQLVEALAHQQVTKQRLGQALVSTRAITEAQLIATLAAQVGLGFVDLTEHPVDPSAVARVPAALCRRSCLLPIGLDDSRRLVVAMADPGDVVALDDLRSITGLEVAPVVATREDLTAAVERFCRADADLDDLTSAMSADLDEQEDLSLVAAAVEDAPIVRYVNLLIDQAITDRASDIHIEPGEHELRVRFRIDGVLHEVMRSPRSVQSGVTSRLKIMADIDIAERRRPQDGRLSVVHSGRKIDLRVATLPTVWGEKVVMRILDNSTASLDLADLGFSDANHARYAASYRKPYGMVLATGPTGSGKSTTLYATLNLVSRPEINVITVEDPVEYRLPGINQVQVNPKAGLTFAGALRSILRSDPDVVLIGEIRDAETATIAVEAALTGHLVLSTLHTNDAPSAITRLTEMGIEPFLVGSALDCVLAQRLARRLCGRCKEPYRPDERTLSLAGYPHVPGEPPPVLHRPVGCPSCSRTGYKGRLALHEVMSVTEGVERLAVERASASEIARLAVSEGMTRLREDGWAKVAAGLTSLEEVLRVVA